MEGNNNGSKTKERGDDGLQQGDGIMVKKQQVTMGMEVLDCPLCATPLSPPIFQCSMGHFICSPCRDELPGTEKACSMCSKPVSDRCHGMERVVASVIVRCSYAAHGCADVMAYHEKAEHEEWCPHAPCFCPEKGCGFAGTKAALVDHFGTQHKWPVKAFKYYEPFEVPVKAGVHVLCCTDGMDKDVGLFLLQVTSPGSPLHGVSLIRVHPHPPESRFGCSVGFSWFKGHYQVSTNDMIWSTSLSDGLSVGDLCFVPEASREGDRRVVLRVTIDTEMVYGEEDELEEEDDDDKSYIYGVEGSEEEGEDDGEDDHDDHGCVG